MRILIQEVLKNYGMSQKLWLQISDSFCLESCNYFWKYSVHNSSACLGKTVHHSLSNDRCWMSKILLWNDEKINVQYYGQKEFENWLILFSFVNFQKIIKDTKPKFFNYFYISFGWWSSSLSFYIIYFTKHLWNPHEKKFTPLQKYFLFF